MPLVKKYPKELEQLISPAYDFVTLVIQEEFSQTNRFGGIKKTDGYLADWSQVARKLELARGARKHAPTEKQVKVALEEWCAHRTLCAEVDVINQLSYAGPSNAVSQLMDALLDPNDIRRPLHQAVLEHFIWQVKRKMHDQPVSYHLMPVVVGRTGSGKSRALERFLAPLDMLVEQGVDFSIFADDRNWHLFSEKYVFLFDEMSKARKTDVESLKNTITSREKSFRRLHTNTTATIQQKATFIGASNDPVNSLIHDPTSARRFWEIPVRDKCDWDLVNQIDMLAIWRSVDEASDRPPVLDVWDEISDFQNKNIRAKSNPEIWLEECAEITDAPECKLSDLFDKFKEWEEQYDVRACTSRRWFALRLLDMPLVSRKIKKDASYYNVKLKQSGLRIVPKGQVI